MWEKNKDWFETQFFRPVFAPLVEDRLPALLLGGIGISQLVFYRLGFGGWRCPIRSALGLQCPGCGLTTSMVLLLRGQWHASITGHAFGPVFLLGIFIMTFVALLPGELHHKAVSWIADLERKSGFAAFILLSLLFYWFFRVLKVM